MVPLHSWSLLVSIHPSIHQTLLAVEAQLALQVFSLNYSKTNTLHQKETKKCKNMLDHLPLCLYHKIVAMATRPADDAHSDGDRAAVACLRATCKSLRRAHAEDDALAVRFGVTNAVESINRLEWALNNCTWAGPKASTSWDCKHSEQQHSESINSHAIFRRKPSWFNLSSLSSSSGDDSLIPTTPTTQESRAVSTSGVPVSCFRFVSAAALRGRTEVLRHLRSQYGAVYDERTAYAAVKGGHLDTLLEARLRQSMDTLRC